MSTILLDVDDVICTNHFIPVINMYLNSTYTDLILATLLKLTKMIVNHLK